MSERMAYVSLIPECGCLVAVTVDEPRFAKDNAKFVAEEIRQGFRIEPMSVEEVRKLPFGYPCEHMESAAAPQAETLFDVTATEGPASEPA